jgi:hypothetical protein
MLGRVVARWNGSSEIILLNVNQFSDDITIGFTDEFLNAVLIILKHEELNSVGLHSQYMLENSTEIQDNREIDKDGYFHIFTLEEIATFAIPEDKLNGA